MRDVLVVSERRFTKRLKIYPIRKGQSNPCKPAGCLNKLLGAVVQTDYAGSLVCLRRRLRGSGWDWRLDQAHKRNPLLDLLGFGSHLQLASHWKKLMVRLPVVANFGKRQNADTIPVNAKRVERRKLI